MIGNQNIHCEKCDWRTGNSRGYVVCLKQPQIAEKCQQKRRRPRSLRLSRWRRTEKHLTRWEQAQYWMTSNRLVSSSLGSKSAFSSHFEPSSKLFSENGASSTRRRLPKHNASWGTALKSAAKVVLLEAPSTPIRVAMDSSVPLAVLSWKNTKKSILPVLAGPSFNFFISPSAPANEFSWSRRFGQDCPDLFQGTLKKKKSSSKKVWVILSKTSRSRNSSAGSEGEIKNYIKVLTQRHVKVFFFFFRNKFITSSFRIADSLGCVSEETSLRKVEASRRLHSHCPAP